MKNALFILTCFGLLSCIGCKKTDTKPSNKKCHDSGCGPSVNCTHQFQSLRLNVTDQNGRVQLLDKVVSTRPNGQSFTFENEVSPGIDTSLGQVFWTDSQKEYTPKTGEAILVKGFINSRLVFSRSFTIGHDCCHVLLIEGDTKVVVHGSE